MAGMSWPDIHAAETASTSAATSAAMGQRQAAHRSATGSGLAAAELQFDTPVAPVGFRSVVRVERIALRTIPAGETVSSRKLHDRNLQYFMRASRFCARCSRAQKDHAV